MKKHFILPILLLTLLFAVSCERGSSIKVWSTTDDFHNMVSSYLKDHPDIKIDYTVTDVHQFENKLDSALASGKGAPDIVVMNSSFVRKYIESGFLLDLTDISEANKEKLFLFPVEVGTNNGKVYGLSWQAVPCAFFYRRSLAKKYFGADDPAIIQTHFSDAETMNKTEELLTYRSSGNCVITGDAEKNDDTGKDKEVFGYILPILDYPNVLGKIAPNTSGDWAMIMAPVLYQNGGSWIGAFNGTKHSETVKNIIQYLTTDENFLEQYALATGELVNNKNVIEKIGDNFYEPFLAGQNYFNFILNEKNNR